MTILQPLNLLLSFLLELALLIVAGYDGWTLGGPVMLKIGLAIALPVLIAVCWGVWMAPRSTRRLRGLGRLVASAILFGLAAIGLWAAGQAALAIVFGLLWALNTGLAYYWKQA